LVFSRGRWVIANQNLVFVHFQYYRDDLIAKNLLVDK
jgi:hypothetical protein